MKWRTITVVMALGLGTAVAAFQSARHGWYSKGTQHEHSMLRELETTLIAAHGRDPIESFTLIDQHARPFGLDRLRGRWSFVFFGFTHCPDVCPVTLSVLAALAREPASGVADDKTQIIFVTIDPARDTPERLSAYARNFHERLIAVTGRRSEIDRLAAQLGAGYASASADPGNREISHSTSVFLLDPQARSAGIFLRPSDPRRMLADFEQAQQSYAYEPVQVSISAAAPSETD